MSRVTREQVVQKIREKHGDSIEMIGEYINPRTHTLFRCNKCGHEWMSTPNNIKTIKNCPNCDRLRKVTPLEDFKKQIQSIHGNNISFIGEYTTSRTKTLFHCNICGNEWNMEPRAVLSGQGCPLCGRRKQHDSQKLPKEEVERRISERHKGSIHMIGEYMGYGNKTLFHCDKCGNEWMATPSHIAKDRGCPKCNKRQRYTKETVSIAIEEKHNNTIEMIGEFTRTHSKSTFHCKKCGHEWSATVDSVLQGHGCPKCTCSKGEDRIAEWLKSNLSYGDWESQKRFEGCRGIKGRTMPFDFYVPSKNMCIEYQGSQHYAPFRFGGKEEEDIRFQNRKEHDRRKRQYCIDNGITLLEIPYTDFDRIEEILNKALKS